MLGVAALGVGLLVGLFGVLPLGLIAFGLAPLPLGRRSRWLSLGCLSPLGDSSRRAFSGLSPGSAGAFFGVGRRTLFVGFGRLARWLVARVGLAILFVGLVARFFIGTIGVLARGTILGIALAGAPRLPLGFEPCGRRSSLPSPLASPSVASASSPEVSSPDLSSAFELAGLDWPRSEEPLPLWLDF